MMRDRLIYVALALLYISCGLAYAQSPQSTLVLQATLRDMSPVWMIHSNYPANWWEYNGWIDFPQYGSCGTANGGKGFNISADFELPLWMYGSVREANAPNGVLYNGEYGLVGPKCTADNGWYNCGQTDSDRKPVYAHTGRSPYGTIQSPDSFYSWWHDNPAVMASAYNLVLNNTGGRTYSYATQAFFPLDNKGWQDWNYADTTTGVKHNYAYCMEIHAHFTYYGGEIFNFIGDDDVWVYMDNRLMIDLGGVHTELSANVQLDQIAGLVKGNSYKFDFFYCERHTTLSKLSLTTSINISCTYFDWCDVCEGDGQSCCTGNNAMLCDDNNACTQDKCAVLVPPQQTCVHTTINCDDGNMCTTEICDTKLGCVSTPVVCNDNNACTLDACLNATGCAFTNIQCPGDKCNLPSCDPKNGCSKTPVNCDDNNACTTDNCDPNIGCTHVPIPCNGDACTIAACSATAGCQKTPKTCDDKNVCTTDSCDTTAGCLFKPINCDDNNACTTDACDPVNGCSHTPVNCDDGNACTTDSCDTKAGCGHQAVVCNDNNACTSDSCDTSKGCIFTNITASCNDNNACTIDSCNTASGCTHTTINCDDSNPCTSDSCSILAGCVHVPTACNHCNTTGGYVKCAPQNGNLCFPVDCDPNSGACNITHPVICNDNNNCTDDSCNSASGVCSFTPKTCNDNNVCTTDSCDVVKGCQYTPIVCNDNNPCTTDACNGTGQCAFTPIPGICIGCGSGTCSWTDPCNPQTCVNGACQAAPVNCNDNNKCTIDACYASGTKGLCNNTAITCNNNDLCNPQSCSPDSGTCVTKPVVCDDNNACTTDLCSKGTCTFTPISCANFSTGSLCEAPTCDSVKGCIATPNICDDNNPCTNDTCVGPMQCNHTLGCDDNNMCTTDTCDPTKSTSTMCGHTPLNCTAPDICHTVTGCSTTKGCQFAPVVCPAPSDWCMVALCDEIAGCVKTPRACLVDDPDCYEGICDSNAQKCTTQQRSDFTTARSSAHGGVTCFAYYDKAAVGGIITGGVIAGIVVGAVIFAVLAALGARQAYIWASLRQGAMGGSANNPLYTGPPSAQSNTLYA